VSSSDNKPLAAQIKTGVQHRLEVASERRGGSISRREFFDWYNHQHRHSGIGLMTPVTVHHGLAEQTHTARRRVLAAAYAARPERFVRRPPQPPALPTGAWINKPGSEEAAH